MQIELFEAKKSQIIRFSYEINIKYEAIFN
jgi:hypothetical protein